MNINMKNVQLNFQDEVGVKNRRVIIGNVSKYIPADQRDKMSDQ